MNSTEKNANLLEKFKGIPVSMLNEPKKEKTRLAVFDFDETLVKSQDMFYLLMKEAMKRLNLSCSEYIVKNIFIGWDKEYFGWGKNLEEQKTIYTYKYQPLITKLASDPYFLNQMVFFDGMKEIIKDLANTDIALAVASSRDLTSILKFMKKEGMKDYFSIIEATEGGKIFEDKPNVSVVNYIAQELGISLENSVMIGDSSSDIKMGKDAGMKTIAAGYGKYANKDRLMKESPDMFIEKGEKPESLFFAIKTLLKSDCR